MNIFIKRKLPGATDTKFWAQERTYEQTKTVKLLNSHTSARNYGIPTPGSRKFWRKEGEMQLAHTVYAPSTIQGQS